VGVFLYFELEMFFVPGGFYFSRHKRVCLFRCRLLDFCFVELGIGNDCHCVVIDLAGIEAVAFIGNVLAPLSIAEKGIQYLNILQSDFEKREGIIAKLDFKITHDIYLTMRKSKGGRSP
jgi:hypothetical protein